ncbi:hypothetical protein PoB_001709500 [Plakobranchus ocellatus]|uniref:Uncharacterized protein n=1 Tax=Plakobranchus ocellatus TaxID=259542 RepID=A0AAV3Z568_9GAST|nr:hypothetical protein PoB_001709500 [Plakobranchus ocellatus]
MESHDRRYLQDQSRYLEKKKKKKKSTHNMVISDFHTSIRSGRLCEAASRQLVLCISQVEFMSHCTSSTTFPTDRMKNQKKRITQLKGKKINVDP